MPRSVSPFKLGLFILICGTLGLVAVIWIGTSRFFEETKTYATYFDESVKGLQKDAIVNYLGVGIGRVSKIQLAPDGRLIEVIMDLRPDFKVDRSLGIQLREQGLTGLRYLEIDEPPKNIENLTPKLTFTPRYPVIPSYPSELQQLKEALQTIYDKVNSLDLKSLTESWKSTADLVNGLLIRVDKGIGSTEWKETVAALSSTAKDASTMMQRITNTASQEDMKKGFQDLSATLKAGRQAFETLAAQLQKLPPGALADMAKSWGTTISSGGDLLSSADKRISESAILLQQALRQLNVVLDQVSALVQSLKEQPNSLVFPPKTPDPFKRK